MLHEDIDRADWQLVSGQGRHHFIEERAWHVGVALGIVLAAWSAIVDTSLDYAVNRVLLECAYFLSGSIVFTGLAALLEWESLRRRFGSATGVARPVRP